MKNREYPYAKHLTLAGALSVAGQMTAIVFMLRANPHTTFAFMTFGSGMILTGIVIFGYVMFRDIKARTQSVIEQRFQAGEFVFRQGDSGNRIYIVNSGEVEVLRNDPGKGEVLLARLGKGAYFGEMALLTDAPRNASVRAATDATALTISCDDFHSLFSSIPAFQQSIMTVMNQRAQPTHDVSL
ncbi:MAG: cyclic nucleotide-binding domain-containing protein [Verrucomicrobia bacterium]|nr:cyclic nucleotide-binding domain-containing protein [Verrucomicrobiota bacterium]